MTPVDKLRAEYAEGVMFGEHTLALKSTDSIFNESFMGSREVLVLDADKSIYQDAPGCLAAPKITLTAKIAIQLGLQGQQEFLHPLRIYAKKLSISAPQVSVGDVKLLEEPDEASLFCNFLTFSKFKQQDPDSFEIIKSWAVNDAMEIDVIPPLEP